MADTADLALAGLLAGKALLVVLAAAWAFRGTRYRAR